MNKAALALCIFSAPLWATFNTLVQSAVKTNGVGCNSGTTCAITVTSTGGGNTGVIALLNGSTGVTISSATGCSTAWTIPGGTLRQGNATTGFTDMAYCLSLTAAQTTITITNGGTATAPIAIFWEVSSTATISFDTQNGILDSSNCTSCAAAALTLGGSNDAIFSVAGCGGTCSAISTYTADLSFPAGDGAAHILNTASGAAPNWTQSPTNPLASVSIALKDSGAGATVTGLGKRKKLNKLGIDND